jgi:ABC-type Fe3+ transport system permease subunit
MVPAGIVLRWLVRAFGTGAVDAGPLLAATGSSIGLAVLAGLAATVAALPGAWLLHRYPSGLAAGLERVTYIASALPGVVIGLALVTLRCNGLGRYTRRRRWRWRRTRCSSCRARWWPGGPAWPPRRRS